MNQVTKVLLTASCLAAAAQAQANWPALLASNTTGFADSVFLGPPDGSFVGLGSAQVTFDFGDLVIVNRYDTINGLDLTDFNLYEQDKALQDAVQREGAAAAHESLMDFGQRIGTAEYLDLGIQANRHPPELDTHDRFGNRVDLVRFHPAYHTLMKTAIENGLHASPWTDPRPGAHVARAARTYLQTQVEAGHGCPITMTFAAVPSLRTTPSLAALWEPKITALSYDPGNVPDAQKAGLTIGMAMTEKQGGSDVRANSTRAYPVGAGGAGEAYELVGHKYFVSAPMCDAFLVLAQAPGGLSCFLLPRWRPDGTKNPMQVLRLKRKMGNVSNASSETELRGAHAWMVGEGPAPLLHPLGLRQCAEPAATDAERAGRPRAGARRLSGTDDAHGPRHGPPRRPA